MQTKITLMLHEELTALQQSLRALGFKIITMDQDLSDNHFRQIVEGNAVVVRDAKAFLKDAKAFDFDIILLQEPIDLDGDDASRDQLAEKIAAAVRQSEIYMKRGNFFLTLYPDGSWHIKEIWI